MGYFDFERHPVPTVAASPDRVGIDVKGYGNAVDITFTVSRKNDVLPLLLTICNALTPDEIIGHLVARARNSGARKTKTNNDQKRGTNVR